MKNEVNWGNGFAIGDTDTKNCPLKCLIFQINEENSTFVTFNTDDSIKWKLMYSIISFLGEILLLQGPLNYQSVRENDIF